LGRGPLSEAEPHANAPTADLAALARGGRINFMGFVLRLAARLPFLFIAGRMYGAAALGRFAYAILIVEFAAQLATLGLKRGLAQQLAHTDKPHPCVAWDALVVALLGSLLMIGILVVFPEAMYPNSPIAGLDRLLPITIIALAWSDIMLAALAYRHDVGATVRARAIVEPWTISIAALVLAFLDKRDGLIIAYVMSMIGRLTRCSPRQGHSSRATACRMTGGLSPEHCGAWRERTSPSPLRTRSNGGRAGSTSRCSGCSSPPQSSASIMSPSRSRPCLRSSRRASTRSSVP